MKKSILIALLLVFGLSFLNAQTTKPKAKKTVAPKIIPPKIEGAGLLFKSETIDYGTIAHKSNGEREFVFTNNGNKALVIKNATSTCGCTVPVFPKDSIPPGEKGVIVIKYDTSRAGPFTKIITVTSNATNSSIKTVLIKGTVTQPIKKKSEPTKS